MLTRSTPLIVLLVVSATTAAGCSGLDEDDASDFQPGSVATPTGKADGQLDAPLDSVYACRTADGNYALEVKTPGFVDRTAGAWFEESHHFGTGKPGLLYMGHVREGSIRVEGTGADVRHTLPLELFRERAGVITVTLAEAASTDPTTRFFVGTAAYGGDNPVLDQHMIPSLAFAHCTYTERVAP
jgi:hypothetical protein